MFMRICNLKTFSPLPSTEFLAECHQPTDQTLMENLADPGKKSLGGVSGGKPQNLFGYNGIKKFIYGLKSYAISKPTCFFWLIHRLMAEYNIT